MEQKNVQYAKKLLYMTTGEDMKEAYAQTGFEAVGGIPVVATYLKRLNIINIIDANVKPLRSNHDRMSHGETSFVLILFLLFRPHAMYKVWKWVEETTYLRIIFPGITAQHFTDDRIGDTLDALFNAKVQNIFSEQSIHVVREFGIKASQIHVDLTNFSVYGDYENTQGINITYGKSKSGNDNLKQFALEAAVTSEEGVPIFQNTLDGNTADVTRYIPMWLGIKEVLGQSNFMLVGDCKLTSENNLLTICRGNGYYLGPLAMYSALENDLRRLVLDDKVNHELLLTQEKSENFQVNFTGFEVEDWLLDPHTSQPYLQRKIFVLSSQLQSTNLKTFESRILKVTEELSKIKISLNKKKYDTREKIEMAIDNVLTKNKLSKGILTWSIKETSEKLIKKVGKGRPKKDSEYIEEIVLKFELEFEWNENEVENQKKLCGYFVLSTNKSASEMNTAEVLIAYKMEWRVERIFERLKGKLQVLPIHLKLPRRIESMMYLLMSCVQVFTLIDLEAKRTLEEENRQVEGLFPNGIKVARPKAEAMLEELKNIGLVYRFEDGEFSVKLTGIGALQADILHVTKVDNNFINSKSIALALDIAEKIDKESFQKSIMLKFQSDSLKLAT